MNKIFSEIRYWFAKYVFRNLPKYCRKIGVQIGNQCVILDNPRKVFGSEPYLIKIGNRVEITNGVRFITHRGELWTIRGLHKELNNCDSFSPISVGNNVMIGNNTIILPGILIGNDVVIGAGSVVTKSVPDGTIVAGVPAKPISTTFDLTKKLVDSLVPTKGMNYKQKKKYLYDRYPKWFE